MKEGGWVGYMESHDEERCAYKQTQWGNGLLQTDLSVQMQQLEANAAFFFMVSGPKMIWQFENWDMIFREMLTSKEKLFLVKITRQILSLFYGLIKIYQKEMNYIPLIVGC